MSKVTDDQFDDLSDIVEDGIENYLFDNNICNIKKASQIAREVASKAEDQLRDSLRIRQLL